MGITKKRLLLSLVVIVVLAGGAAFTAKTYFMQRPKTTPHDEIQYVLVPGTTRAGLARTTINRHHMRAVDADTYPVLIFGDSVMQGWARIDQRDTAVSILTERLGLPVGNASASSWGPPNQLAYARRLGLFGAEVVVLVLSSHDAADVPGYNPPVDYDGVLPEAIEALGELIDLIADSGATPIVALHLITTEMEAGPLSGHQALRAVAEDRGIQVLILNLELSDYNDLIHPNHEGQRRIADQLQPIIEQALRDRPES